MDQTNFAVIVLLTAIALVFFLLWIIVVLPQSRARKTQQQVVAALKVGDEIVTVGGMIGTLTYLNEQEDMARIEVAKGVEVRIIPAAISHPLDYVRRVELAKQERVDARRDPKRPPKKS